MKKLRHTIRLTITDDTPGPVQRSRELFSFYIKPASLLVIIINLAALLLAIRDIVRTLEIYWTEGIGVLLTLLIPLQLAYATG